MAWQWPKIVKRNPGIPSNENQVEGCIRTFSDYKCSFIMNFVLTINTYIFAPVFKNIQIHEEMLPNFITNFRGSLQDFWVSQIGIEYQCLENLYERVLFVLLLRYITTFIFVFISNYLYVLRVILMPFCTVVTIGIFQASVSALFLFFFFVDSLPSFTGSVTSFLFLSLTFFLTVTLRWEEPG